MKQITLLILLALSIFPLFSQKKTITEKDFAAWNRLENRQLSSDAKYIAYEVNSLKGDGKLIIYNTATQKSDTVLRGAEAKFVPTTDFVVFRIKASEESIKKAKIAKVKKEQMPKDSIGILNLKTGTRKVYGGLKSFAVAEELSDKIVVMLDKQKEAKVVVKNDTTTKAKPKTKLTPKVANPSAADKDRELFDVWVLQPQKEGKTVFNRVESYAIAKKGNLALFYGKQNDTTKVNVLISLNTATLKADTLLKDSITLKRLTIDEKGERIAFLASKDTTKTKAFDLYYSLIGKQKPTVIVDSLTLKMTPKWTPSENGELFFSPDGKKLFFGMANKPVNKPEDKTLDEDKPKLDIWSYKDDEIQPKQLKNALKEKNRTYLALYRTDDKRFVQLADSSVNEVRLLNRNNGELALGINNLPYLHSEVWKIDIPSDYYLVDLKTGAKTRMITEKNSVSISPNGGFTLWVENGNFMLRNNKTAKITALTQNMKVSFVDEQNDSPSPANAYGVAGWSEKESDLLLYDRYDIWKFDTSGKSAPVNLTNGRATKTRYRYERVEREEVFLPSNKPLLFSSFNEKSSKEGYHEYWLGKSNAPKKLIEGDFMLSGLAKAKQTDAYIWSAQTTQNYPEIQFTTNKFTSSIMVSKTNPQQSSYNWLTVEKVQWLSFAGDTLNGLLYKPENFDPNRKYPMVVYFYERNSENYNRHSIPQPSRSIISIPHYCSNEYIVFVPDITYKIGYPGQSAYNAIVSGVQSLINTRNYINPKKMALQGQSWGGYQTAYLITQTNLFAAAMAGAPVSNMTSAYGGIRWGTGLSRIFQYEQEQSRIGGTLWEKPLLFLENSPVFMAPKVKTPLLIMSNDNDGAVPWYQGIEYFMALYRLNKPVWLLNYNGMEHNLEDKYWANRMDLTIRMMGFFDHYLKDKPAPSWMVNGIKAIDKGEKLGY